MRHDCVAFFTFYLQEALDLEVPPFHEDIWGELLEFVEKLNRDGTIQTLKKLFAVPREHAKTTIAKLATILFLKYTKLSFLLYVSKTQGHGKNAIKDILGWLESPQERELHGHPTIIKNSETEGLWQLNIQIRTSMSEAPRVKRITMKALGSLQQVRGLLIDNKRPDLIILDDIEDLDNTTIELQPKLDRWLFGSLLKSFAKTYFVIMIGNMLSNTTILYRLSKDSEWNPTVLGSLVRNRDTRKLEPLWQGRHTLESLLKEYSTYRRMGQGATWEAEMMNLTMNEIYREDMKGLVYVPKPNPEDIEWGAIVLDPAFGKNSWNDDSAFTVHVKIKGIPIPAIVESRVGKFTELQQFEIFLELSYYWGLTTWVIEAQAAQKLLISYFNLLFQEYKIRADLFTLLPIQRHQDTKASAILAFRKAAKGGNYGIADTEFDLVEKLGDYDPTSKQHDDLCDSASYGLNIWIHFSQIIEINGIKKVAMIAHGESGVEGEGILLSAAIGNW
jgi:hypothetical protein